MVPKTLLIPGRSKKHLEQTPGQMDNSLQLWQVFCLMNERWLAQLLD